MKHAVFLVALLFSMSLIYSQELPDFTIYTTFSSFSNSGFDPERVTAAGGRLNFAASSFSGFDRIGLLTAGSEGAVGDEVENDELEVTGGSENGNGDVTSDGDTKRRKKIDREKIKNNPITRDLDFSWIREKYRLEKLFIAIGVVSLTMGVPFILSGVLGYLIQPTDTTELGNTIYFALIGVGGGLMGTGTAFVISGGVRLYILKKNNRIKLSFLPHFQG